MEHASAKPSPCGGPPAPLQSPSRLLRRRRLSHYHHHHHHLCHHLWHHYPRHPLPSPPPRADHLLEHCPRQRRLPASSTRGEASEGRIPLEHKKAKRLGGGGDEGRVRGETRKKGLSSPARVGGGVEGGGATDNTLMTITPYFAVVSQSSIID